MIVAALMLLAAPATEPELRRESFSFVGAAYPGELSEQINAYQRCLRPDPNRTYFPDQSVEQLHRSDVERCEDTRASMVEAAYNIWKEGRDPETAREEVENFFAAQRDDHIAQGVQLDQLFGGAKPVETSDPND